MPNTTPVNDNATVTSYIDREGAAARRRERVSDRRDHQGQRGRGTGRDRVHEEGGRGGHFRRRASGDERARDAAGHGVRAQPRDPGDQPLRGSASERGRRHARRRGIGAPGPARHPGLFGRRDGGARHPAGGSHRRALSRGAHFVAALGGDGGVREDARGWRSRPKPRRIIWRWPTAT